MTKLIVSPRFQIIGQDLKSIGIGLAITMAGAGLTFLTEIVTKTNFAIPLDGQMMDLNPFIVPIWAMLVNTARKFLTEKQYIK